MKVLLSLSMLFVAAFGQEQKCPTLSPVRTFKYADFEGKWYEVGHYRNSVRSQSCFCSTSNVTKDALGKNEGDSVYSYTCNKGSATGELQAFGTKLFEMRPPGQWKQSVVPGFDPQTFTVLDLHDGHALVYRCGEYAQYGISYNAQFLSRTKSLTAAVVEKFKAIAAELKLNPACSDYETVSQEGCTYKGH